MSIAQSLHVTLPKEMADLVRAKIASGEYSSAIEVVQGGLQALLEHDAEVEHWLRGEVASTFDGWAANPERAKPLDEVAARMDAFMNTAVLKASQV